MPRVPKKLTEAEIEQVEGLAAVLTVEQMSDYFGVGRQTFFDIMERQPEIARLYKKGRSKAIRDVAKNLVTKARDGDTACMMFYLKTQAGWREKDRKDDGEVERDSVLEIVRATKPE